MKKLSVFIVEDNFQTILKLKSYIEKHPNLLLIGNAVTGNEALENLDTSCDLLLLDVHLPDMSGIDILQSLKEIPVVIFITAYDKYAVKAFEFGAVDYLLKPFSYERFVKSIDRILSSFVSDNLPQSKFHTLVFNVTDRSQQYLIPYKDIFYITSNGKSSIVHTMERDIDLAKLLLEVSKKLPPEQFVRIHKKYIVNVRQILSLEHIKSGHYQINFIDDVFAPLPVGRSFVNNLKTVLH